jgi:hypothetical protein
MNTHLRCDKVLLHPGIPTARCYSKLYHNDYTLPFESSALTLARAVFCGMVSLEAHYVISSDLYIATLGPFIKPTQQIIQQGIN